MARCSSYLYSGIQALLSEQLRPKYFVRVDERIYISDGSDPTLQLPDRFRGLDLSGRIEVEIHEAFLKLIDVRDRDVVTVIEILSPATKLTDSPGGQSFEQKRREIMSCPSHWVEIDLLRGNRMVPVPQRVGPHEYLVHVSKADVRPRSFLYPIRLPQRLPVIPIPLKPADPGARLDLQAVLDSAYDRAGYDLGIDYRTEPKPPLDGELARWADQLLRSKGLLNRLGLLREYEAGMMQSWA